MKKLLVILTLVLFSTVSFAAQWYTLPQINIKPQGGEWIGWQECQPGPIEMLFEPEKKQVTIYSKSIQVINYSILKEVKRTGYTVYTGPATDVNYKSIVFEIYHHDNGTEFILISYSDIEYMYVVKKVE